MENGNHKTIGDVALCLLKPGSDLTRLQGSQKRIIHRASAADTRANMNEERLQTIVLETPQDASCHALRVVPIEDKWSVDFVHGQFSFPQEKDAAIAHAVCIAKWTGCSDIAICNREGKVSEVLNVKREQ